MIYQQSKALYDRARRVLAGGVSSEFRRASTPHPLFYRDGAGSYLTDVDGNTYLDFSLSQGPLILGHSHPEVLDAVAEASARGQLYAGQHLEELELAETIQRLVPSAERLRFGLDGSGAVHAALRTARAATGRGRFIRFEGHYHGWFDNVAFGVGGPSLQALGPYEHPHALPWSEGLPAGARDEATVLPWNDLELAERVVAAHHRELAAIITEPVMCNSGCIPPAAGFLEGLRDLCTRYDLALIFDEVITGFRLGLGGAQGYYGVRPDLSVFAKALASGYSLSAVAGTERWMRPISEGRAVHAGTMNSSAPTVAAARATLRVLERDNVHPRLFELGGRLAAGLRRAAAETGHTLLVQGPGPMLHAGFTDRAAVTEFRGTLAYDRAKGAAFVRGLQEAGVRVLGRGLWYVGASHTAAEVDAAVAAAGRVLGAMKEPVA